MTDTTHIHDFNPGFGPAVSPVDSGNGFGTRVFWTAVIPDSDVQVEPAAGTAHMHVNDLAVLDYFSPLPTGGAGTVSLGPNWQTASVDATVSFDVVWNGPVTRRVNVRDAANGFAGLFNENQATVTWSAISSSGFTFTSNPGNFSTSVPEVPGVNGVTAPLNFFAEVGHERNGIFFAQGDNPGGNAQGDNQGGNSVVSIDALALLATGQSNASTPSGGVLGGQQAQTGAPSTSGTALQDSAAAGGQTAVTQTPLTRPGPSRALDRVFADLQGSAFADALQGAEVSAWAV